MLNLSLLRHAKSDWNNSIHDDMNRPISLKGINKTLLENNGILPQEFIYKKHSIDSLQFANSNDYYAFDTEVYEGIINKVKEKIESDKAKYEAINEEELKAEKELREARAKELKKSPKVLKEFKEVKQ